MQLHQFDLNLLRSLDVLLDERSVTRAAKRLHVTQQAMSGALRRLREQFDDPLLVRSGRALQLTARASALVGPVRDVLQQIERAVETRPQFDAATSKRRFSVAMSDYSAMTTLPAAMARLSFEAPRTTLDVKPLGKELSADLASGHLDLCLLPSDLTLFRQKIPAGVRAQVLYDDDFVCVVSSVNRSVGEMVDTTRYLRMPHAALRPGDEMISLVEVAWSRLGMAPPIAATATSFATLVVLVSDSALIATVQRRLARHFARMLPIRVLECPIPIDRLSMSMIWPLSRDGDPAHHYLREVFASASTAGPSHKCGL